jgi:hypothetical protein
MTDKTELRGLCPSELAQALDAIAMSEGMDRNTYVVKVLDAEVRKVAHKQMMLARTLKGNPYLIHEGGNE